MTNPEYVVVEERNPRSSRRPSRNTASDAATMTEGGGRTHYRQHAPSLPAYSLVDDERAWQEDQRWKRGAKRASTFLVSDDSGATKDTYMTPAVFAAKKELRFDPVQAQIEAQNVRISQRPKLHQEVKGILKNAGASQKVPRDDTNQDYDELRHATQRLELQDRDAAAQMQAGHQEDFDPERLRRRFGRRSRIYYSGDGLYKYM
jgi:hypothetical protein